MSEEDTDIYEEAGMEDLTENDEMDDSEEGFMRGWKKARDDEETEEEE